MSLSWRWKFNTGLYECSPFLTCSWPPWRMRTHRGMIKRPKGSPLISFHGKWKRLNLCSVTESCVCGIFQQRNVMFVWNVVLRWPECTFTHVNSVGFAVTHRQRLRKSLCETVTVICESVSFSYYLYADKSTQPYARLPLLSCLPVLLIPPCLIYQTPGVSCHKLCLNSNKSASVCFVYII